MPIQHVSSIQPRTRISGLIGLYRAINNPNSLPRNLESMARELVSLAKDMWKSPGLAQRLGAVDLWLQAARVREVQGNIIESNVLRAGATSLFTELRNQILATDTDASLNFLVRGANIMLRWNLPLPELETLKVVMALAEHRGKKAAAAEAMLRMGRSLEKLEAGTGSEMFYAAVDMFQDAIKATPNQDPLLFKFWERALIAAGHLQDPRLELTVFGRYVEWATSYMGVQDVVKITERAYVRLLELEAPTTEQLGVHDYARRVQVSYVGLMQTYHNAADFFMDRLYQGVLIFTGNDQVRHTDTVMNLLLRMRSLESTLPVTNMGILRDSTEPSDFAYTQAAQKLQQLFDTDAKVSSNYYMILEQMSLLLSTPSADIEVALSDPSSNVNLRLHFQELFPEGVGESLWSEMYRFTPVALMRRLGRFEGHAKSFGK